MGGRRTLVVEADGGSRGNPGPAGYGAVVRDADTDEVLAEVAASIGTATNNVAEYRGLIAGLEGAAGVDADAVVQVRMDSKLVVEQMSGRWRIKHPDLMPLARRARDLAQGFAAVSYTWIPREKNRAADQLANAAMDGAAPNSASAAAAAPAQGAASGDGGAAPERKGDTAGRRPGNTTGWRPPETVPTRLILLRHGQTPLSVERRFAGVGDIELTSAGHDQAEAAALALAPVGIDAIVSSPLRRAWDTAAHVAKQTGREVTTVDGLRETDFGLWEGHTFAEVRDRWPDELNAWLGDTTQGPPGGESFAAVRTRVLAARDQLLSDYPEQTILAVSHVTPIKLLVGAALLAPLEALYRMHLDLATLCEIHFYADGQAVVVRVNDTAHLRS